MKGGYYFLIILSVPLRYLPDEQNPARYLIQSERDRTSINRNADPSAYLITIVD